MVFPEGSPPGVGMAVAKTAMETAVKRASLENMVKMIEREWVRVVVLCWVAWKAKYEVGYSTEEFGLAYGESL